MQFFSLFCQTKFSFPFFKMYTLVLSVFFLSSISEASQSVNAHLINQLYRRVESHSSESELDSFQPDKSFVRDTLKNDKTDTKETFHNVLLHLNQTRYLHKCLEPNCTINIEGVNVFYNYFIKSGNISNTNYEHDSVILKSIIYNSKVAPKLIDSNRSVTNANDWSLSNLAPHTLNNITINFINIESISNKRNVLNVNDRKPSKNVHREISSVKSNDNDINKLENQNDAKNNFSLNNDDDYDYDDSEINIGGNAHTSSDNTKLIKLVMDGLGLQKLPDMNKVNISQMEYTKKYREYIQRLHEREKRKTDITENVTSLGMVTIKSNTTEIEIKERNKRDSNKMRLRHNNNVLLNFPLKEESNQFQPNDIDEANVRLMMIHSPALAMKAKKYRNKYNDDCINNRNKTRMAKEKSQTTTQKHFLNLKVYYVQNGGKRTWLDGKKIEVNIDRNRMDESFSQWLQFDVTKAIEKWFKNRPPNLRLEVQCDNCQRYGARILNDDSFVAQSKYGGSEFNGDKNQDFNGNDDYQLLPVLNIIGRLGVVKQGLRTQKDQHDNDEKIIHHHQSIEKHHKLTNCLKKNQRCCRHTMEVIFKEIKGFEFIIQPKVFDAGYCHGRCPPRYNPAHHHAMLQSLIWKNNRSHAPRPCCAPSKLMELEVLHVDEKDSEKLKISTWSDMQVIECACS